jgi:AraC-like DNA-binding protein
VQVRHRLGGYVEFEPPEHLTQFVEATWLHHTPGDMPLPSGVTHRVLPDPALGIAFVCARDTRGGVRNARLVAVGPVTRPREFRITPGVEMVSVKLKLERARDWFGIEPWQHADSIDDMAELNPRWTGQVLDALGETNCAEAALAALVDAVRHYASGRTRRPSESVAHRALDVIRWRHGAVELDRLSHQLGVSGRHLRRTVIGAAGVTPKHYARVMRFLHAVTRADETVRPRWARLAAEAGYSDQSHLIRECRALTGLTPSLVFRERRAESEMSNLSPHPSL